MRKLAWFVIIVLIAALVVAVACAWVPGFSSALYDFGVNTLGIGIITMVTGLLTGMMAWGATGLAPSVAILAGTLIAGSILWIVILRKYAWGKIKAARQQKVASSTVGGVTFQREPAEPEPPPRKEEVPPTAA